MRRVDAEKCPLSPIASNLLSPLLSLGCEGSILWCDLCGACGEWYRQVVERWLREADGDASLELEVLREGSYTLLLPADLYRDRCFGRVVEGIVESLKRHIEVGLAIYSGLIPLLRDRVRGGGRISWEAESKVVVMDRYSPMAVEGRIYTLSMIIEGLIRRGEVFIRPGPLDLYVYRSAYPFYNREAERFVSLLSGGFLRTVRLWGPRIGLGLTPLWEEYRGIICPYLRVRTPSHKGVLGVVDPMLYIALRRCVGGLPVFFLPYYVALSLEEA